MIKELKVCRACGGSSFGEVINLGNQYVVGFPKEKDTNALSSPLHVVRCVRCGLAQLVHAVEPEKMFETFWYKSGISESMRRALDEIVRRVNSCVDLNPGDRVLDIGSNDGTLLEMYPPHVVTVGIDPCEELVLESSREHRVDLGITGFFSKARLKEHSPFKAITAIAMFYDIEEPRKFLSECRDLLAPGGLLLIQMNYLKTMMEETTVDNISHEHLTYWSLTTLSRVVESVGLEIQGVETNAVNGGSFRVYITRKGQNLDGLSLDKQMSLYANVARLIGEEQAMGLDGSRVYEHFRSTVAQKCDALRGYVLGKKKDKAKLYLYGASTRGTALMQVLNFPEDTFIGAAERDERKYGRVMVGSWVPIFDEQRCRADATHMLVLPYHFKEQIVLREQQWLAMGGTMIFPLPMPSVLHDGLEQQLRLQKIDKGIPAVTSVGG